MASKQSWRSNETTKLSCLVLDCMLMNLVCVVIHVQAPLLNSELVNSSHLLIVQNMLSTERIEVLLSKFALDNSSVPLLNSSRIKLVLAHPNLDGFYSHIAHLNSLLPRIPKLVLDQFYHVRKQREC